MPGPDPFKPWTPADQDAQAAKQAREQIEYNARKEAERASHSPTGRLAHSTQPNIQNIPIRTPEGTAIREALKSHLEKK